MSTLGLVLMILGAIAAFAYGIWAGLGTYRQDPKEIERALGEPGRRRKVTRHFTPMDLMSKMTGVPTQRDRGNPFRFDPEDDPAHGSKSSSDRSSPEKGVDGDEDGADDGAEQVAEPNDQA